MFLVFCLPNRWLPHGRKWVIEVIHFSEGKLMNKLIAALIACAFALGSVGAMAQGDKTPPEPVDQAKLKADRAKAKEAKADLAKMTPEEKKAARKAKAAKKQGELAGQQMKATDQPPATAAETAAIKAQKSQPKALPDKKAKQDALQTQEKSAVKGGGGN
jgi:hypothetical protein